MVTTARRLLLPALLAVIVMGLIIDLQHRPFEIGIDFHTYEAAGLVGSEQGWQDLYDQGLVKLAQEHLVPTQRTQPFLSPPPVAWITAPLGALPYGLAFDLWSIFTLGAFALALAFTTSYRGWARLVAVGAAVVPWWVLHAVGVGQVVPLVAAGILVAWRLQRDNRDVWAGIALALILLKPNTAILAPAAVLAAGWVRMFTSWLAAAVVVVAISLATLGPEGVSAYLSDFGHLPPGANWLTLDGTFGLTGLAAAVVRLIVVVAALATAYRLRSSPGMPIAIGVLASLITATYLHASDLCMLVAAGWIIWHEWPAPAWRVSLLAIWALASPFVFVTAGPLMNRWGIVELALFVAIVLWAWTGVPATALARRALTATGAFNRQAPA